MVKSALLVVGIQDFNYENIDDNNYRNKVSKFLEYARFIFNSEEIIHINGSYICSNFKKIINKYNKKNINYNSKQCSWVNRQLYEPVYIKTSVDISKTGIVNYLLHKNIKRIYMIGLFSSLCINYNALELSVHNFDVVILKKYCADINKDKQNEIFKIYENIIYKVL